jgi:hypothetical protein
MHQALLTWAHECAHSTDIPAHPEREAVEGFNTFNPMLNPARDNL